MKYNILLCLAIQSTTYNIMSHHAHIIHYPIEIIYFLSEMVHIMVCLTQIRHESLSIYNIKSLVIPFIILIIHNVTINYGIEYLEPTLRQLIYQLNILFATLISPKRLSTRQIISAMFLFIGIVIVLVCRNEVVTLPHHSQTFGILCTIAAAGLNALYNQYVEDVLKSEKNTTWTRQLQLALCGQLLASVMCLWNRHDIINVPISAWCLVVLKSVGNILIPFVLKYMDNMTKIFSDTVATFFSLVISQIIYNWHPQIGFYSGTMMIIVSTYLFLSSGTTPKVMEV